MGVYRATQMAHRTTLYAEGLGKPAKPAKKTAALAESRELTLDAFRRWGYLEATLDPLDLFKPLKSQDLETLTGEAAEEARGYYCGTIGAEFMHLPEPERRRWIAERMESPAPEVDQKGILERLVRA